MVKIPEQATSASVDAAPGSPGRWHPLALVAMCAVAAVLYAWRIGAQGWGNPYYSAAVKSMSANLTNFVFGSFDPLGVVTVDKPPMAFWPMVLSAAVFGYHGWSLLLPQVLEGVAAVFLLHRTVRLWAGEHVALLAALVFALTPVTVAINRDTNPDTLMVLLLVAGAYAFTRSVQRPLEPARATRWLLLAAVFLGLGFVTKMLQAWIVVPAFAVAYLVGSPASVRRRLLDVLGAGVVLLASSLWWVALVSAWPGPKPYIGGSTDGSVLNLVIGYNGLGRIFGRNVGRELVGGSGGASSDPGSGPWSGARGGHGGFGGRSGITRLFGEQVGGQISWLLPLCLLVLVAVAIAGVRQRRSGLPPEPARRAGWFLWGGWLLLVGLVLSYAQGGFHSYYTTEMAPALAAVTAAGVAAMERHYRQPGGYRWVLLPAAVTLTVLWAWVLVSRDLSWNGWLRYAVAGVGAVAVILLVTGRLSFTGRSAGISQLAGVLAAQRRFLTDVSHQVATPLATIMTNLSILRRATRGGLAEEAVTDSVAEAERMKRMLGRLRSLAHADEDIPLRRELVDLAELTADVVRAYTAQAGTSGVGLVTEVGATARVSADKDLLREAVANLVDNAVRVSPRGAAVRLTVGKGSLGSKIAVIDSGPGIDHDRLGSLFDRFQRSDSGSGLGLAIARRVVERHGGTIKVDTAMGTGSTFTIELPEI